VWSDRSGSRFNAFVVAADGLLAAGHTGAGPGEEPFLALLDTATGADLWRQSLPAASVKCGVAVDHRGRIVAALDNGQVLDFAGPE
jgi:outer membrane protein assembly factor BamB